MHYFFTKAFTLLLIPSMLLVEAYLLHSIYLSASAVHLATAGTVDSTVTAGFVPVCKFLLLMLLPINQQNCAKY